MHVRVVSACRHASVFVLRRSNAFILLGSTLPHLHAKLPIALQQKQLTAAFATAASAPGVAIVKVGKGNYFRLNVENVENMDSTAILKAVKASVIFANSMKDVPLENCNVRVVQAAGKQAPEPADEVAAVPLGAAVKLGDLIGSAPQGRVYLHVTIGK
jgi:hypothetical protein